MIVRKIVAILQNGPILIKYACRVTAEKTGWKGLCPGAQKGFLGAGGRGGGPDPQGGSMTFTYMSLRMVKCGFLYTFVYHLHALEGHRWLL